MSNMAKTKWKEKLPNLIRRFKGGDRRNWLCKAQPQKRLSEELVGNLLIIEADKALHKVSFI